MTSTPTQPSIPLVNNHIHTPFSFSAFSSIEEAVRSARNAGIRVLGISDFNTVNGYEEFDTQCNAYGVYPLFNIEFIVSTQDREVRWNDPKNPGTMYFCGKGLAYPSSFSEDSENILSSLWKATQDHIWKVISACNAYVGTIGLSQLSLDYHTLRDTYARFQVRERHVALALYHAVQHAASDDDARLRIYRTLFQDPSFDETGMDAVALQNEIRTRLLKYGKPAYVPQDDAAFLPLDKIRRIILDGGGIPCYPILADGAKDLTEHERDPEALARTLMDMQVHAVEFIPKRNAPALLRTYVEVFHSHGFLITFGTEHNTPVCDSPVPQAANHTPLDPDMVRINYDSACVYAAHRHLTARGEQGYVDGKGMCTADAGGRKRLVQIGRTLITPNA